MFKLDFRLLNVFLSGGRGGGYDQAIESLARIQSKDRIDYNNFQRGHLSLPDYIHGLERRLREIDPHKVSHPYLNRAGTALGNHDTEVLRQFETKLLYRRLDAIAWSEDVTIRRHLAIQQKIGKLRDSELKPYLENFLRPLERRLVAKLDSDQAPHLRVFANFLGSQIAQTENRVRTLDAAAKVQLVTAPRREWLPRLGEIASAGLETGRSLFDRVGRKLSETTRTLAQRPLGSIFGIAAVGLGGIFSASGFFNAPLQRDTTAQRAAIGFVKHEPIFNQAAEVAETPLQRTLRDMFIDPARGTSAQGLRIDSAKACLKALETCPAGRG